MNPFYQLSANSLQGQRVPMQTYRGKVLLVVNTASKCGLTPHYQDMQQLYEQYADQGLVVLGFPCNQFRQQEPGDADAIGSFCETNYGVRFPMFDKVEVNGPHAHPIFRYLREQLPGWFGSSIKWNFTKFLIGRDGAPIRRFAPTTRRGKMEPAIQQALAASGR
jgi:glutathione peroxidase